MIHEVFGKDLLLGLTETVLNDTSVNGAVVRGCFDVAEMKVLSDANRLRRDGLLTEVLMQLLPELDAVGEQVRQYWESNGYTGYSMDTVLHYTDYIPMGRDIGPHIDYYDHVGKFVQVGISFSLSSGDPDSGAVVRVSRSAASMRTVDGDVDVDSVLNWQRQISAGDINWDEAVVGYGDLFILPQHPRPAGHGVVASSLREAYILDYIASK